MRISIFSLLVLALLMPVSFTAPAQKTFIPELSISGDLCYPELLSNYVKYWKSGNNAGLGIGFSQPTSLDSSIKCTATLSLIGRYGSARAGTNSISIDLGSFTQPYFSPGIGYYHLPGSQIILEQNTQSYDIYHKIWSDPTDVFLT